MVLMVSVALFVNGSRREGLKDNAGPPAA
jgi:hypothetical protein